MDKSLNFQHRENTNASQSFPDTTEWNLISDIMPGGLIKVTLPDFFIYSFNKGFCQLIGYSEQQYQKLSAAERWAMIHPKDQSAFAERLKAHAMEHSPLLLELRLLRKNGEVCWVQLSGRYLEDYANKPAYLCSLMDISQKHAYEEQNLLEQQRSSLIAEFHPSSFWEYDFSTESMIRYGNLISSYSSAPLIYNWNHYVQENALIYPDDLPRFQSIFEALSLNAASRTMDIRIKNHQGIYEWKRITYKLLFNKEKEPVRLLGQTTSLEVPDLQAAASVSLLGKTAFIKNVHTAISEMPEGSQCGLMLICLPRFMEYKKTYGAAFCQSLTQEFSLALFEQFSENILGYLGNGRFLLFLTAFVSESYLKQQAQLFLASLENLYISQAECNISCNIGLVLGEKNSSNYDILYKKACIALETAKKKGNRTYDLYGFRPEKERKEPGSSQLPTFAPTSLLSYNILKLGLSLVFEKDSQQGMEKLLSLIGEYYHADHVFFLEGSPSATDYQITLQWHAPEAAPLSVTSYPQKELAACYQLFDENSCLFCSDFSSIKEKAPLLYESLLLDKVHTILQYALQKEEEYIGILGLSYHSLPSCEPDLSFLPIIGGLAAQLAARRHSEDFISSLPTDPVTGLPSLHYFLEKGRRILEENRQEQFALVYLDISNFHLFNQNFGFSTGNRILERFALSLQDSIRANELCCRVERDHFALLLHYVEAEEVIERLNRRVHNPLLRPAGMLPDFFRFSIVYGVYYVPPGQTEITEMLDYANAARKSVKGLSGSHYACYTPHLSDTLLCNREILQQLQLALEQKRFFPLYQPVYSLTEGRLLEAEALSRWEAPLHGLALPADFLPFMEKSGMIIDMEFQLLEAVCQLLRERLRSKLSWVPVSLNLSELHLKTSNFIPRLLSVLSQYEIPISCIHLELREDILVRFPEESAFFLRELKLLGFFIIIDRFGESYASLMPLKTLEADAIKLNLKAFFSSRPSKREWEFLRKVIEAAKELGLAVYASNVEQPSWAKELKALGCLGAQGYHYSRPVSQAELEDLLL